MRSRLRTGATSLVGFMVLYGLWFLLAGTTERWQAIIGVACAVAATAGALWAAHLGAITVRPRAIWLARSLAAPWWIVRDTAVVLGALPRMALRPVPRGRFRSFRFPGAAEPSARGIAGRAIAEGAGSAGPNTLVLGSDDERPVLLVHELVEQSGAPAAVTLLEER
ncbi:MAG TPA: hypothetical protein VHR88_00265 [Solirubrobacteraceae bacterium]|nr:hypothetical protein [Solirubrobacteraceae bacterium]